MRSELPVNWGNRSNQPTYLLMKHIGTTISQAALGIVNYTNYRADYTKCRRRKIAPPTHEEDPLNSQ